MSLFIVRFRPENYRPSLVGIYRAASPSELAEAVAQDCPSQVCEYALVQHGAMDGAAVESGTGARLHADAADIDLRAANDLSEDWRELFGDAPLAWHGFDAARRSGAPLSARAA